MLLRLHKCVQWRLRPMLRCATDPRHCIVSQVWVGVLPVGPSGGVLNSSFRTRDTAEYKLELGQAIVNVARIVPDGVLVFFPSYTVLSSCIEGWQQLGAPTIWYDAGGLWRSMAARPLRRHWLQGALEAAEAPRCGAS